MTWCQWWQPAGCVGHAMLWTSPGTQCLGKKQEIEGVKEEKEKGLEGGTKYRIIELFWLEKNFKIIESHSKPNIAKSTSKPCPQEPHLQIF